MNYKDLNPTQHFLSCHTHIGITFSLTIFVVPTGNPTPASAYLSQARTLVKHTSQPAGLSNLQESGHTPVQVELLR